MTSMTQSAEVTEINPDDFLNSLLNDLDGGGDGVLPTLASGDEELLEIAEVEGAVMLSGSSVSDDELNAMLGEVERKEASIKLYEAQKPNEITDGVAPATTVEHSENADVTKEKGKKKAAKADGAEKKQKEPKAPKEPKELRATSVTHKPGALLKAKLGATANDFLVFSLGDIELPVPEMLAKVDAFVARMDDKDAIADKVREKIILLLTWVKNNGKLNTVLERTIRLLVKDGQLTSGDKGNLQTDLLAKPFSTGTARSQSNQMFMALPEVGICLKEKGRMVPNPDSTLLPIIISMLGL
jgi:hypothetical protein